MRKFLTLFLLPVAALTLTGAAALPAEVAHTAPSSVTFAANEDDDQRRLERYVNSKYLPMNRWQDMTLHSRLNWFNPGSAATTSTALAAETAALSSGNAMWKVAGDWMRSAESFDVLTSDFAYNMDRIAGFLGDALFKTPLFIGGVVLLVLSTAIWRVVRTGSSRTWIRVAVTAAMLGLIMFSSTQASLSTSGAAPETYKPRVGTPVWAAQVAYDGINTATGAFVAPVVDGLRTVTSQATPGDEGAGWSCDALVDAAIARAESSTGVDSTGTGASLQTVTMVLNTMWVKTAAQTYSTIQFGDNEFAKHVWCHQLERMSSMDAHSKVNLLANAVTGSGGTAESIGMVSRTQPMLSVSEDSEVNDRVMIAWAACEPKVAKPTSLSDFRVRPGFVKKHNGQGGTENWITPAACYNMWVAADDDAVRRAGAGAGTSSEDPFNVQGLWTDSRAQTGDPRVINFLDHIHAADQGALWGGAVLGSVYAFGAFIATLVFGVLALAVMASKLFMVLMLGLMFLLLIVSLFRSAPLTHTLAGPAKRLLSVTLFAFGAGAITAAVATLSLLISSFGSIFGGPGSVGSTLWVAVSPLMALVAIHFLFTKVFHVASPVTPAGMVAWGVAGGALGGAVASGASRMVGGRELARTAASGTRWMAQERRRAAEQKAVRGAGDGGARSSEEPDTTETELDDDITTGTEEPTTTQSGGEPPRAAKPTAKIPAASGGDAPRPGAVGAGTKRPGESGGRSAAPRGTGQPPSRKASPKAPGAKGVAPKAAGAKGASPRTSSAKATIPKAASPKLPAPKGVAAKLPTPKAGIPKIPLK